MVVSLAAEASFPDAPPVVSFWCSATSAALDDGHGKERLIFTPL
jgi:hypothetical protein